MVRLSKEEEYYTMGKNGITRYDGRIIKDVIKELNKAEYYRRHHKKKRAELEKENMLLWDILDGVRAYIKLKYRGRDYDD